MKSRGMRGVSAETSPFILVSHFPITSEPVLFLLAQANAASPKQEYLRELIALPRQ